MSAEAHEGSLVPPLSSAVHLGIVTAKFYETWDFYTTLLGFRTIEENDGYVRLRHSSGAHIGILQHELNGEWSELVSATEGRGLWLMVEVDEPAVELERARAASLELAWPASPAKWGSARFMMRDPNGVLIFVQPCRTERRFEEDEVSVMQNA